MAHPPQRFFESHLALRLSRAFQLLSVLTLLFPFPVNIRGAFLANNNLGQSHRNRVSSLVRQIAEPIPLLQQNTETLKLGESLDREMKGGEIHSFKLLLAADGFLHIAVEQQGINVALALFDPEGKLVGEMDSPNNTLGLEHLSLVAETTGEYRLEIRSTEKWANAGRYVVNVTELRPATPLDLKRVAAERSFMEAEHYSDPKDEDLQKQKLSLAQSRQQAIERYKKALADWHVLDDAHGETMTYYRIGANYRLLGDFDNAVESFDNGLKAFRNRGSEQDWRLAAGILNDEGVVYIRSDVQKALELFAQAKLLFEAHNDNRGLASSHNNVGVALASSGNMHDALDNYLKSLPIRKAEHQQSSEINLLNNIGGIYDSLGDPHLALEYYAQALKLWQESKNRDKIPVGLNNVAKVQDELGEWQEAKKKYEEALSLYGGDKAGEAATLVNLGSLYETLGDPEMALQNYNDALDLLRATVKDKRLTANVLTRMGQVDISLGKLDDALKDYNEALNEQAQLHPPESGQRVSTLMGIAAVTALRGNTRQALEFYLEALKLRREVGDRRGEAVTLDKLGETYTSLGEPQKALESFEEAVPIWRAVEDSLGLASSLQGIAQVELARGRLVEALKSSDEAVGIVERSRVKVSSQQLRTSYFATKQNYYELRIDINMRLSLQNQSSRHLAIALQASESSRARSFIDTLAETRDNITEGASEDLLRLQRRLQAKSIAQTSLLSSKHNDHEAAAIAGELVNLIRQYDEAKNRIRTGNLKYANLTEPQPLTLSEIQNAVDENTVLVEYALGDKRSYVWVVSPNSIDGVELPARDQIEAIARRVTAALTARNREEKNESFPQRHLRIDQAEKEYAETSAALSKMILGPLGSLLGKKRLVVVADGALQLVPFAALPAPADSAIAENQSVKRNSSSVVAANATPLISEHEIISLPSASVLALQRRELSNRKPAPLAVAVLADPVFDLQDERVARARGNGNQHLKDVAASGQAGTALSKPGAQSSPATSGTPTKPPLLATALRDVGMDPDRRMPRLALSRAEAMAIARAAPANQSLSALDFKASRETATSPELSKYRIIHFATHGVLDLDHPELSGIVLSMVDEKGRPQDGYLRLHEIYNLNLPAELVVLSACQTGIGKQVKGEGLIALTRGFMYAGAARVVASLWKVDDAATSELMGEFYKQMFTNKLKPAAALRAAQIKMSSHQKRWQSPYYWAGFFLQGEWN
ncbi:MAG TPA: hypothetical protein DC047_06215 [Blastocatellia bacterium]|nr:hypothetical protein [Blastocatellia bacterium]